LSKVNPICIFGAPVVNLFELHEDLWHKKLETLVYCTVFSQNPTFSHFNITLTGDRHTTTAYTMLAHRRAIKTKPKNPTLNNLSHIFNKNAATNLAQVIQLGCSHAVIPRLVVANLFYSWKPQCVPSLILVTSNDLGRFDLILHHTPFNV